jgi:membrane associated rhomboid family serine protease
VYGRGQQQYSFGPPVTPQIIKTLIIANCVVYAAQMVSPAVNELGPVTPIEFWQHGYLWQPFTYMWMHSKYSVFHILFNMFSLWMFGSQLALLWGEQRFLRFYLACGIGAGFAIATIPYLALFAGFGSEGTLIYGTLGASGAVMGCLLAFSFTWPDRTIQLLFPPIPIKAIWLIPLIFAIELFSGPSNVSHVGHLGGVVVGWIYLLHEGRTPGAPTLNTLILRWKRYRMRRRLRAVHDEERRDRTRRKDKDDRPFH